MHVQLRRPDVHGLYRKGYWKFAEKKCRVQYSVMSGTIFHSRKFPYLRLLKMIIAFTDSVKGISALKTSFVIDCGDKATYLNLQKLRQAMASDRNFIELYGKVEIDGAIFGGRIKPANLKKDRKDRRLWEHKEKKRVIIALRQRRGPMVAACASRFSICCLISCRTPSFSARRFFKPLTRWVSAMERAHSPFAS